MNTAMKSSSGKSVKMELHHTEVHPAENGGMIVEHHMRAAGEEYGPSSVEKHAFGEDEHADAMKEVHSKLCSSGDGCFQPTVPGKDGKSPMIKKDSKEAEYGKSARSKVGAAISALKKSPSSKDTKDVKDKKD